MRAIWTIAKRDCLSLVKSPMYLMLAAICCAIWSYQYLQNLFNFAAMTSNPMMAQQGGQNIQYTVFLQHISVVHLVLLFVVPALTVWLLAQEKRQRTYDLLLTAPISATDIALGKFFGGWASILLLVFLASLYPILTGVVADFSWPTLWTALGGVVLISGFYVAVGIFASSLTESIFFSYVLAILFNLAIWFLGASAQSVDGELANKVLTHISIGSQLFNFLKGTIKISTITFFVTAIGFFVFMTQRVVESSRWR